MWNVFIKNLKRLPHIQQTLRMVEYFVRSHQREIAYGLLAGFLVVISVWGIFQYDPPRSKPSPDGVLLKLLQKNNSSSKEQDPKFENIKDRLYRAFYLGDHTWILTHESKFVGPNSEINALVAMTKMIAYKNQPLRIESIKKSLSSPLLDNFIKRALLFGDLLTESSPPEKLKQLSAAKSDTKEFSQVPLSWMNLGLAQFKMGNYPEAASAWDKAHQLEINFLWLYQLEGELFEESKNYSLAAKSYKPLLNHRTTKALAAERLGRIMGFLKSEDPSYQYFGIAVSLKDSAKIRYSWAETAEGFKDYSMAKIQLDKALPLAKTNQMKRDIYFKNGQIHCKLKDTTTAFNSFNRAFKIDRNFYPALEQKVVCAKETKNYSVAANTLEKLLTIRPKKAALWIDYGEVLQKLGKKGPAKASFKRALEIDPQSVKAKKLLGKSLK